MRAKQIQLEVAFDAIVGESALFDLSVDGHPIELWAELFQFEAFCCVAAIFLGRVARHARNTFFRIWDASALSAFKRNNNTNPFVFGHL